MAGYSFLKKWIYLTPGVEEVNINAYNDIEVIMNSGRSVKIPEKFSSPQHAIDVVRRMLSSCGMILDDTMPSVVGYLDKNIRISVDKTPIVDPDVGQMCIRDRRKAGTLPVVRKTSRTKHTPKSWKKPKMRSLLISQRPNPVSYTHLDVYKRQRRSCRSITARPRWARARPFWASPARS